MTIRMGGQPFARLNHWHETNNNPVCKRPTMHDEGDENIMKTVNWIVAGNNSMEMHGYTEEDKPRSPTIKALCSGSGEWSFTFKNMSGTGRIQVGKGADYNPLDLIESLYHHITTTGATLNKDQPNPKSVEVEVVKSATFDKAFSEAWE